MSSSQFAAAGPDGVPFWSEQIATGFPVADGVNHAITATVTRS
jgi:hypothetical protein